MRTSPRAIWQLRGRGGWSADEPGTKERPAPGESASECSAKRPAAARAAREAEAAARTAHEARGRGRRTAMTTSPGAPPPGDVWSQAPLITACVLADETLPRGRRCH